MPGPKNRRALALAAALCLTVPFFRGVAAAGPTQQALQKSRAAFERGKVAYRLSRFGPALKEFRTALGLVNRPSVIFNIAQCHRQFKQPEKAVFYYRLYLDEWARQHPDRPSPLEAEVRGRVKALTATVRRRHRPRTASGRRPPRELVTVDIESQPKGAEVTLDSRVRGTTPLRLNLPKGDFYLLILERERYLRIKTTLDVQRRKKLHYEMKLGPAGISALRDRNDYFSISLVVGAKLASTSEPYVGAMLRLPTLRWGRFYWSTLETTVGGGDNLLLCFISSGGVVLYLDGHYRHQLHLGLGAGAGVLGVTAFGALLTAHVRYQLHAWGGAQLSLELSPRIQFPQAEEQDWTGKFEDPFYPAALLFSVGFGWGTSFL